MTEGVLPVALIGLVFYTGYVVAAVLVARGLGRIYERRADLPSVSIVVPARDEAHQISALLDSLLNIDYPHDRLQILVANDQSHDGTREVALSYRDRFQCRYDIVDVQDEPDGKLKLKTRPLAQGLDQAVGEIVLMTDADCVVPRHWVRAMVSYFGADVGMVCGTTIPHPSAGRRIFTWFETLDWLFLLGVGAGLSGNGRTQGLIGNNYSVRRAAYRDIGTYRALTFTDIDDLSMQQAIESSRRWRVVFPADPGVIIHTRPVRSLREMVEQRRRWIKGISHVGWDGRGAILLGIIGHVVWPLLALLVSPLFLAAVPFLIVGDGIVLWKALNYYDMKRLNWAVPFYPLGATLYGTWLVLMIIAKKKVRWKEQDY